MAAPERTPDRTEADPILDGRWLAGAVLAVAARPTLWATAVRQVLVLAGPGWWRRPPRLPVPDAAYLRFRLVTAYGADGATPTVDDLVTYLHWCRAWPRIVDGTAPVAPAERWRQR